MPQPQDFTIVQVRDGRSIAKRVPLVFHPSNSVRPNDKIRIVQHPKGSPKSEAEGKVLSIEGDGQLHYDADTLPGSSGSPVLDKDWNLVGIHHAGHNGHEKYNIGTTVVQMYSAMPRGLRDNPVSKPPGRPHAETPQAQKPTAKSPQADQPLEDMSLSELKARAQALGITDPDGHKGHKQTWIDAIENS